LTTVVATSINIGALAFSNQRKIDRCQNGVIWTMRWDGSNALAFSYSTDNGTTWTASGTISIAGSTYTPNASFFIDIDDYAHVVYKDRNFGYVYYQRGTPNAARTAWTWSGATAILSDASADQPDVVAHREGTGWKAHVVFSYFLSNANNFVGYVPVTISSAQAVTVGASTVLGSNYTVGVNLFYPSVDFNHTGDAKTVAGGTPHLYVGWSARAANGIRFKKATYSAGAWSWGTERILDSTRGIESSSMWLNCLFDGTRVVLPGMLSDGTNSDVVIYERDAGDTTTTTRVLLDNAVTTDQLLRGSGGYDAAGNVYLVGQENSANGPLNYRRWVRASASLDAKVQRDATGGQGFVSAKRGYSRARVEWLYTDGTASPYSVTYDSLLLNTPPNAPILSSPANNATIDRGITQRFAWTFSDPDVGDSQSAFDLQYRVVGTTPWTTVSATTPNAFYDFAASTFAAGNYEWQVRTYDSQGVVGPWCSSSFFTAATAPAQPTITAPVNGATVQNTATLTWSAPNQTDYQWRRVADNAGSADTSTIYQDSGDVVDSTTRSVTLTFDTNNRYEHIQVRIKNAGLWSSWADIRVQVSYTPPTTATFTMAADPTTATRTLTITNPAPGSGVPATSYNDVYVRTAASSTVADTYRPYSATGTRIGTALATNTAFVDRTPAGSPVVYEYRVVSVASNGTASDSGWQATA
jgi:hypothetical protein